MSCSPRRQPTERDLALWEFMQYELLDHLYTGLTGRFQIAGHRLIDRWAKPSMDGIVIEVGCGHGHHLRHGGNDYRRYIGLDIEYRFLHTLQERFPGVRVVNGDAYTLPFRDRSVDCVLSVYCFEHLRRLPDCLGEIWRVLKPEGELLVGLPAEGGFLYGLGRSLTSKPYMERKYGIDYDAIVHWEHWNTYNEVKEMLEAQFKVVDARFIPFSFVPGVHVNVIGCLRLAAKDSEI
jgi:SAM-dependent methyltransferase